ncbi:MAG: bifunctional homocysteine S-methyltransferase/methylenetetrahydrofolate reductase [Candidatus Latescibacteria bacterium]|nr:bifunctional homocysteine S-methyltransferase/methylenetetrahydrofolate reductase [Candidatus Latescibacterota bacterium]
MKHPFLAGLESRVVLADGAMGTLLYDRGIPFDRSFDLLNVTDPMLVQGVHRDYIRAGAELIETNTFGANRFRLGAHGAAEEARRVNRAGAQIARNAREEVGEAVFVAGAIGPLGKPVAPIGTISKDEALEAYSEQAEGLVEGGVDLVLIETQTDLEEMKLAVQAVRGVTDLPLVAQMTFTEDGRTLYGAYPEDLVRATQTLGVDVLGANCSVGPQKLLEIIQRIKRRTELPISVMPNAGLPRFVNGRFLYLASPDYFAGYAAQFKAAGARLIGGCCGTTPAHIRRMREALAQPSIETAEGPPSGSPAGSLAAGAGSLAAPTAPSGAAARAPFAAAPMPAPPAEEVADQDPASRSLLARKLSRSEFVVSVEVDPPRGARPKKMIEGAQFLKRSGVDTINVADSPMARVRMSSLALATMITHQVGVETILHFTCRDRNLMGIQSDLMGAHALGLRNILALTGDPPRAGDYPNATAVFDVDSIGLIRVLKQLNAGTDLAGNSIGEPTRFLIGCAVNPAAEDFDSEIERFRKKVEAGAEFTMTQPLYELETLTRFLQAIEKPKTRIPILLGLLPLQSHRHAEFLHNEVPGINIPDHAREAMRSAGEKGIEVGIEMCRALLLKARGLVEGVYLMPSFGRYEVVARVAEVVRSAPKAASPA